MLQANELRIGNYVIDWEGNKVQTVKAIRDNASIETNLYYYPISTPPNAIPLTEEWLLKFGFKRKKSYLYLHFFNITGLGFHHVIGEDYTGLYIMDDDLFDGIVARVKHVHQLQNLYFSLTNTEL